MRNREELENEIIVKITQSHENGEIKKIREKAEYKLKDYFAPAKITQIMNKTAPLSSFTDLEMCNIALFFIDNGYVNLKLDKYCTDTEINEASLSRIDQTVNTKGSITFNNVIESKDEFVEQYITKMQYSEIAKMEMWGLLE